jgi:site-specific DNA-methyltransferase (adenine-specific)
MSGLVPLVPDRLKMPYSEVVRLSFTSHGNNALRLPSYRTAATYVQAASVPIPPNMQGTAHLTLDQFLRVLRAGRRAELDRQRQRLREQMAEAGRTARVPDLITLARADCRRYRHWPDRVDAVATDPPWTDLDSYRWLSIFCSRHLRPGGLALVQCGTGDIGAVLDAMKPLRYVWTMAIVYSESKGRPSQLWSFCPQWRPVVVLSRGEPDRAGLRTVSDVYTVRHHPPELHEMQQPLAPWTHWVRALTRPGELVVDPYCGSGTTGAAVQGVGEGRRWVGVEIDLARYRIARARLANRKPPGGRPGG